MALLARLLFPVPASTRTLPSIVGWWERRRLVYNVAVGAAGTVSLAAVNLLSALPPSPHPFGVPVGLIVVYGGLANLMYCSGWLVEAGFQRMWKEEVPQVGPVLYRYGLVFSVGLSLLPVVLGAIDWAARVVGYFFR